MTAPRGFFTFALDEHLFALDLASVREVVAVPALSLPPGTPSILRGFLNLEGKAIPVLDLRRLFQWADAPPNLYAHLLVLRTPGTPLAVLVDRAVTTAPVEPDALLPIGEGRSFNDCVECDARIAGATVHVLSLDKLLLEEERRRIAELHAMEQERLRGLGEAAR